MAGFPKRGDIFIIDINPETGSEDNVPVAVVQNNVGNEFARSVIVAAVKEEAKPTYDLEIVLPKDESGLSADGVIRTDRIYTLDRIHFIRRIGSISSALCTELDTALGISLGLSEM